MAFMTFSKKGISALEMQRQLGHKRYGTVWKLMHKIRDGMGKRDSLYQLNGSVEFDEGYFEQATPEGLNSRRPGKSKAIKRSSNGKINSSGRSRNRKSILPMQILQDETLESHEKAEVNQLVVEFHPRKSSHFF
jgi:hypothetical protein